MCFISFRFPELFRAFPELFQFQLRLLRVLLRPDFCT